MYDVLVVGGGPCGASAAEDLAKAGYSVALLDRPGRIKPCGGSLREVRILPFMMTRPAYVCFHFQAFSMFEMDRLTRRCEFANWVL